MHLKHLTATAIATFLGVGRCPFAPGTAASFVCLPPIWLIHTAWGPIGVLAVAMFLLCVGIWASGVYIEISGSDDPGPVVVDEVVGQAIAISFLPVGPMEYAIAFIFFRIFDISKIWPANWAEERLVGGMAVMLDDVVAGLYAGAVSLALLKVFVS